MLSRDALLKRGVYCKQLTHSYNLLCRGTSYPIAHYFTLAFSCFCHILTNSDIWRSIGKVVRRQNAPDFIPRALTFVGATYRTSIS